MTAAELSTMVIRRERARTPWDSMPSGRPVSDVDSEALRDFIRRGNEAGRISGEFSEVQDALAKLGLIAVDGSLTNAAVELFCEGSDVYPRMMLGLLGGNTKAKILDLHRETGTMLKLLDYAEYFATSNIRREFVIGKNGMYRQEIPEIPAEAIREAVANALCHRDYTTGTPVQVNVYMDTVQIVSPGLFPAGDSPEKHLAGCADAFRLRNPKIAQALFRAGVIEQFGTGIPRIRTACEKAGVEFRFEQTDVSTVIVFERPGSMVAERVGDAEAEDGRAVRTAAEPLPDGLSKNELVAMKLARDEGRVTTQSLCAA